MEAKIRITHVGMIILWDEGVVYWGLIVGGTRIWR